MSTERQPLAPLQSAYRLNYVSKGQLALLQAATLEIMESVGVRFPSRKALEIFAGHGAQVDWQKQIVRLKPDFVLKVLANAPRYFKMGARDATLDLQLQDGVTYFTTDGCGVETIDFETRQRRPSCKEDVGKMARMADYLGSIGFYWPMVSAQDFKRTAPLHELDASWNNTVKHVQSETVMGESSCRYAVEMATVIAGSRDELRRRPPLSLVVCTIAPLVQDEPGIEGALVMAEAGIPVGFLAMPTLGTTARAGLPLLDAGLGRSAHGGLRLLFAGQPLPLRPGANGPSLGITLPGGLLWHRCSRGWHMAGRRRSGARSVHGRVGQPGYRHGHGAGGKLHLALSRAAHPG
jgi:trimethylamine:corrinoid methyltransferase-like protein